MQSIRIHLICHGDTRANLEGRYIGVTDEPLAPEGVKNLEVILENAQYPPAEKLYISPCLRCRQTAAMLYPRLEPREIPELREYNFGVFEDKSLEQLKALYPKEYAQWISGGPDVAPPEGETSREFLSRIVVGLDSIVRFLCMEGRHSAAVVTHGGVIMTLLTALAYPKKPFSQWVTEHGMGYTLLVTPSLWMRDQVAEAYGLLPSFYRDVDDKMLHSFGLRDTIRLVEAAREDGEEEQYETDWAPENWNPEDWEETPEN